MFRTRHYIVFALLTYLWCATGLDRIASLGVFNSESDNAFVVAKVQPGQMVIHHMGHRDAHEPTVQDGDEAHDEVHGHGDHVVPYCDDDSSATFAKEAKAGKPPIFAVLVSYTQWLPQHVDSLSPLLRNGLLRSAALEFARTLRLLI